MNRKNIYIILSLVVILVFLSLFIFYFFYKKDNKVITEQQKIDTLDQLNIESKNNYTDQQKIDILNDLSATSKSEGTSELTREQRIQIMQASSQ